MKELAIIFVAITNDILMVVEMTHGILVNKQIYKHNKDKAKCTLEKSGVIKSHHKKHGWRSMHIFLQKK